MWREYKITLENKTLDKSRTQNVAIQFKEADDILNNIISKLQEKVNSCITYIEQIDDSVLRQAMFYKFIKGKTWVQVSFLVGSNEDAIRQKVNRYFKKTDI